MQVFIHIKHNVLYKIMSWVYSVTILTENVNGFLWNVFKSNLVVCNSCGLCLRWHMHW